MAEMRNRPACCLFSHTSMNTMAALPWYTFSIFSMIGAIILQGIHFLAPRSIMVTIPLTGTLLKSRDGAPAEGVPAVRASKKTHPIRANIRRTLTYVFSFQLLLVQSMAPSSRPPKNHHEIL